MTRTRRAALAALVVVISAWLLVDGRERLVAPFGMSHDGWNGSVWALGGRAMVEEGPLDSRFGAASRLDREAPVYAHHPPLAYSAAATAHAVAGDSPVAARSVAVVASLGTIVAVVALLAALGGGWVSVAAGAAVALSTPMFLVYGITLATPTIGLPFGAGLLAAYASRAGRRRDALLVGLTAGCVLASWQSALLAGLVLVALAVDAASDRERRRTAMRAAIALVLALVVAVSWLVWVNGSADALLRVVRLRSGPAIDGRPLAQSQLASARDLFPIVWPVVPLVAVAALAQRRYRKAIVISAATVVVYAVAFRNAASIHDYWNYWLVLPLAVGVAATVDVAARRLPRVAPVVGLAVAILAVGANLGHRSVAEGRIEQGYELAALIRDSRNRLPDTQRFAYYTGIEAPLPMYAYYSRRPGWHLNDEDFAGLARREAGALVLVHEASRWRFATAADLAA